MTKIKIDLIMETFLKEEPVGQLFEPTKEGAAEFINKLKGEVKAPYVNGSVGSLGKPDTVYMTFGLEPREKWGIFENSIYFKMTIDFQGTMEVFSGNLSQKSKNPMFAYERIPVKFRKSKAKNADDAVVRLNKFIAEVYKYYESIGITLN